MKNGKILISLSYTSGKKCHNWKHRKGSNEKEVVYNFLVKMAVNFGRWSQEVLMNDNISDHKSY